MTNKTATKGLVIPNQVFVTVIVIAIALVAVLFLWRFTAQPHTPRVNLYPRTTVPANRAGQ